jgi:pimeloyl-ACP methyl ester carboxylesterase
MVNAALERWFTRPFRLNNPKTIALVRGWLEANDPMVYPKLYRVLVEGNTELVDVIQNIKCPTLVMTSQNDHGNTPEMTHRMADAIPGARSVILPKLMHMALAEDPDQINGHLLAFLRNTLKV